MITDMPRPRPPHLHRETNRHGKPVWYVRVGKGQRIRIRAEHGTKEFEGAYQAALRGEAAPVKGKFTAGTLGWLIDRYRESAAWTSLSLATRRQRENIFKHIVASAGNEQAVRIDRKTIAAGRDRRRNTPNAARHFVQTMRGLYSWAAEAELVPADPTQGVSVPRSSTDGHHTWTEEECARFEAKWPLGTRERVAFDVLLYTGLRRGDAVKLGRPHVRDGVASIRTEKTGEMVTIPILPPLAASIAAGPIGDLTFIAGKRGRPVTKESFGTWFREACNAAGVPGSAHGLRKAGATRAAENGATVAMLEALFGWRGGGMASLYTRKADRTRLAKDAAGKLMSAQDANIYSRTLPNGAGAASEKTIKTGR